MTTSTGSTKRPVSYPGFAGLSWISASELEWLISLLPDEGLFVEVGTASGVKAAKIAQARRRLTLLSVDSFPDHDAIRVTTGDPCRVDSWRRNRRPNMTLWLGTLAALERFYPDLQADSIFVDAGHEEAEVYDDLLRASRLLAPGGTLFVHDFAEPKLPGVRGAVDRICRETWLTPFADHQTMLALRIKTK